MDTESDDRVGRRRQGGGASFLIVLIGTACLVAAWILSTSDPYDDLANRVVQVGAEGQELSAEAEATGTLLPEEGGAAEGPIGLLPDEGASAQGPIGLLPDAEQAAAAAQAAESASFRQMLRSLPRPGGAHPAELDRTAALRPVEPATSEGANGPAAPAGGAAMAVPAAEYAEPPDNLEEVELTRAQRRAVQRRLGMAGHDAGGTDGVFGPHTREAVAAYQEASSLPVTGKVDEATLEVLRAETDAEYAAWAEAHRATSASRGSNRRGTIAMGSSAPAEAACRGIDCALAESPRDAFGGGQRGGAGFQPGADR